LRKKGIGKGSTDREEKKSRDAPGPNDFYLALAVKRVWERGREEENSTS